MTLLALLLPLLAQAATISNTATARFAGGQQVSSNTVVLETTNPPTPSVTRFFGPAPGQQGSQALPSDGTQCAAPGGVFSPVPALSLRNGNPASDGAAGVVPETTLRSGDPLYVSVSDGNRNQDAAVREFIEVLLRTTAGDRENLRLQETGPNTGVFAGAIQTVPMPPSATTFDCRLSVSNDVQVVSEYVDSMFNTDTSSANVLVDPFGVIFDSVTGEPVNGFTVQLINADTGLPATVFGDDGVTPYPNVVITGQPVTIPGQTVTPPPGGFRFPLVPPGNYRLVLTPAPGFSVPSTQPLASLLTVRDANGNPYTVVPGSFGNPFPVPPGSPPLNVDVPTDAAFPNGDPNFVLQKVAATTETTVGEYMQYQVTLANRSTVRPAPNTVITDVLPNGFKYVAGSARLNGSPGTEPVVSADGRSLRFTLGTVAPGATVRLSYVAQVGVGAATGTATNTAGAASGTRRSNNASATVQVREAFSNRNILIGRVIEGECDTAPADLRGVEGARVVMEDGSYTAADRDGLFHFEGVRSGTHVVQLDLDSLPAGYEAIPCIRNSRFAGSAYSQFVDQQGPSLWRTDFYVRRKPPVQGEVGVRLVSRLTPAAQCLSPADPGRTQQYVLEGGFETRRSVLTSAGARQLDALVAQIRALGPLATVRVVGHTDNIRIAPEHVKEYADNQVLSEVRAQTVISQLASELGLKAEQLRHAGRADREPVASNSTVEGRARNRRVEIDITTLPQAGKAMACGSALPGAKPQTYVFEGRFDSRRATLRGESQGELDALISRIRTAGAVERIEVIGHTDNVRIAPENRREFADNQALSLARAQTVGGALASALGLVSAQVQATGRGEDEPRAANNSDAGRAANRRVEVRVYPAAPAAAPVAAGKPHQLDLRVEADAGLAAVQNLRLMLVLPEGVTPLPGTLRADGKALPDGELTENILTIRLGDAGASWKKTLELQAQAPSTTDCTQGLVVKATALFDTSTNKNGRIAPVETVLRCAPQTITANVQRFDTTVQFDSRSAALTDTARGDLSRIAAALRGAEVARLEVHGHADSRPVSPVLPGPPFRDNQDLSEARAQAVTGFIGAEAGIAADRLQAIAHGSVDPVASNATPEGMAKNRRADGILAVVGEQSISAVVPVEAASPRNTAVALSDILPVRKEDGAGPPARVAVADDAAANGKRDWMIGQKAGAAILFPMEGHNPRTRGARIVIKHAPAEKPVLRLNGREVSGLNYDGSSESADKTFTVTQWAGVDLADGDNLLEADLVSEGRVTNTLRRTVHFSGSPVRAELVPEASYLRADGINKPVIAIRLFDRDGKPVRNGITGPFQIVGPFESAQKREFLQNRALAGLDRFQTSYKVEGDDGLAYIEFTPTTESGSVTLNFNFDNRRPQELRSWIRGVDRDWLVVGFAEGSVGYNTLKDNTQPLAAQGIEDEFYTGGTFSMYAKGRVLGKWLLTLAYDSDKPRQALPGQTNSLNYGSQLGSVIDPDEYYTLYGDGTEQYYDASSIRKLYVKIERQQFYALFGDYDTGMTRTQLSRYGRTLNGLKTEYDDGRYQLTAFASETPQTFGRIEIQGNGTSGLYGIGARNLLINSERVRIETRDRFKNEQIVDAKYLQRHIDYDIDYSNGTLFFREPVFSRDTRFNPIFIVAEYETLDSAEQKLNAGGRAGINFLDGRLNVGVTALRESSATGSTNLQGLDLKLKVTPNTELRLEGAMSDGTLNSVERSGGAYVAEIEHRGEKFDVLAYERQQAAGFGVNQQNGVESGTHKTGADFRYHFTESLSLDGQIYRQQNTASKATRDAGLAQLRYQLGNTAFGLGVQSVRDEDGPRSAESQQVAASIGQVLMGGRLELEAGTQNSFGGKSESVDFPDRYIVQAGYKLTESVKLIVAEEYTTSERADTQTTRVGMQMQPWQGSRIDSTLNQSIGEFGPRTYGQMGLTQALLIGERWGLDFGVDQSSTFNEQQPGNNGVIGAPGGDSSTIVINPNSPLTSGNFANEDYTALTAGATYRADRWSWAGRAEWRDSNTSNRIGLTTGVLRQASAGVAYSAAVRYFDADQAGGDRGRLVDGDLSVAWRPLESRWSVLNRFRLSQQLNSLTAATVAGGSSVRSTRFINNLSVNRVSRRWNHRDRQGNLFALNQRAQFSLYYGAKYVTNSFAGEEYSGFVDLLGFEGRYDITPYLDVGLQASVLHSWDDDSFRYSAGPQVGVTPFDNGWMTLGYNVTGYKDRDFDAAQYSAQGPYLKLRVKFDQNTRLFENKATDKAQDWDSYKPDPTFKPRPPPPETAPARALPSLRTGAASAQQGGGQ